MYDDVSGDDAEGLLAHGEVFQVLVCLEECVARQQLIQDAPNTPLIRRLIPRQPQNDFKRAVVARADDGGVAPRIVARTPEIDNFDVCVSRILQKEKGEDEEGIWIAIQQGEETYNNGVRCE